MKIMLITLALSFTAIAQEPTIEQGKANVTANLDRQISNLQTAKTCVAAANTREALQKCRQDLTATKKKMSEENKVKRALMMKKQTQLLNSRMKNRKPTP